MENFVFYPMTQKPVPDKEDISFSRTVIIYSNDVDAVEFGYYDFEQDEWFHFGKNEILLRCWCYIPVPNISDYESWAVLEPKGYERPLYK